MIKVSMDLEDQSLIISNILKKNIHKNPFLLTNYRSRASIVQGANRLITYNKEDRIPKAMVPAQKEPGVLQALSFKTVQKESDFD